MKSFPGGWSSKGDGPGAGEREDDLRNRDIGAGTGAGVQERWSLEYTLRNSSV